MKPTSHLFSDVMLLLWSDPKDHLDVSREATAIASYVKNHRVNAENAFEVLQIMWPEAKVLVRRDAVLDDDPERLLFDVSFADKSQAIVGAVKGIGSLVDVVS
ncbi:MAG: hypothetical protein JSS57_07620 [Proteobacteria bacterium]|nr:hypothetical protein [Pseudomonadota bacterium]